jgi:cyanate lyase
VPDNKAAGSPSTIKELIEEKFGPGIVSATDFKMDIEHVPVPCW